MARDGCYVLRLYPEAGVCSGYPKAGELSYRPSISTAASRGIRRRHAEHRLPSARTTTTCISRKRPLIYWDPMRRHIGDERWTWLHHSH